MLRARSAELMNGKVVFSTSRASNCVSSVLPSVSAVMPVPSETKKTDRCVMARSFRSFRRPRQHQLDRQVENDREVRPEIADRQTMERFHRSASPRSEERTSELESRM